MLTAKEQAVMDLRQQGWSCKQIAEHLGISRNTEEYIAWRARRRLGAGNPLRLPGTFCVFRFGPCVGVLPTRYLRDWSDKVWAARPHIPWLSGANERPDVEILLGGIVQLTLQEAATARRALAGTRKPGVYKIGHDGSVTKYSGETAAARAEGVNKMRIHLRREAGAANGYYWL